MRSLALALTTLVGVSCASVPPPPAAPLTDPAPPISGALAEGLSVSGRVVVRAFDRHRVLVGIDTWSEGSAPDGIADHVILATTTPDAPLPDFEEGDGTIEVRDGVVRVTVAGEPRRIVFVYGPGADASGTIGDYLVAATIALSDTTGQRFALVDLATTAVPATCADAAEQGCFRLDSGRILQFPF